MSMRKTQHSHLSILGCCMAIRIIIDVFPRGSLAPAIDFSREMDMSLVAYFPPPRAVASAPNPDRGVSNRIKKWIFYMRIQPYPNVSNSIQTHPNISIIYAYPTFFAEMACVQTHRVQQYLKVLNHIQTYPTVSTIAKKKHGKCAYSKF